ncbi:MAG: methyltransferase domain-containing protein [Candidatus Lokiarchaeota archaeon]|nr:methyltransferase domain-containing protein [Candidatus Lokiarchaeota archaeon]
MEYWEKRFLDGGKIWGTEPSQTAKYALELFKKHGLHKILVPGAGYGRNTKLFSDSNLGVVGIEISESAINIARSFNPKTQFFQGSVLDMPFDDVKYDGIYSCNVLHLLLKDDRILFLKKCYNQLKLNGFAFFAVFSDKEKSFGKGKRIEENTYESKPWRPTHYFTEFDLKEHFKEFTVIETGIIEDHENHGDLGPHSHILRYIFAKKK